MNVVTAEVEPSEFARLYDATFDDLWRYTIRACAGDRSLAEDLVQEAYTAAYSRWVAGRQSDVTIQWLVVVARNKMVDEFRKRERARRFSRSGTRPHESRDDFVQADSSLTACIQKLPPLQRTVVSLRFVDDMTIAEIGAVIGKRPAATDSLLRRALRTLHESLTEEPGDDG